MHLFVSASSTALARTRLKGRRSPPRGRSSRRGLGITLAAVALLAAVASAQETRSKTKPRATVVDALKASKGFARFAALVESVGMTPVLQRAGPYTVLVPSDKALAHFVIEDKMRLRALVSNHIVRGRLVAADLADRRFVRTLAGRQLNIEHADGVLAVGGVIVKAANIPASNGILHVISGVLAPSTRDLARTVAATGAHKKLAALLAQVDLDVIIDGAGPYTLFAPTDDAFADLDLSTLSRSEAAGLLRRHVASGRLYATDALRAGRVVNLEGEVLAFRVKDGREMLANAIVTTVDLDAANGVVHAVDRVLTTK